MVVFQSTLLGFVLLFSVLRGRYKRLCLGADPGALKGEAVACPLLVIDVPLRASC